MSFFRNPFHLLNFFAIRYSHTLGVLSSCVLINLMSIRQWTEASKQQQYHWLVKENFLNEKNYATLSWIVALFVCCCCCCFLLLLPAFKFKHACIFNIIFLVLFNFNTLEYSTPRSNRFYLFSCRRRCCCWVKKKSFIIFVRNSIE
jgi:hypothetical protein